MTPVTAVATAPVCDFCGARPDAGGLTWYPCRTFTRLTIRRGRATTVVPCACCCDVPALRASDHVEEYISLSAWTACGDCRAHLDAGDAEGLLERAVGRQAVAWPTEHRGALRAAIPAAHEGYWRHRLPQN